jgi:hypothetical protein
MKHRLFLFALLFAVNFVQAQNTQTFSYLGPYFQIFVVPTTGWYFLDASGGQGGAVSALFTSDPEQIPVWCYGGINQGGKGARMQGYVRLEAGDSLRIAVAGAGGNGTVYLHQGETIPNCHHSVNAGGGGGGASSIVKVNGTVYTPLLFAAGGGGASYKPQNYYLNPNMWEPPYAPDGTGLPGSATIEAGSSFEGAASIDPIHAGTNGNGGAGSDNNDYGGAGGAGYYTDGWTHYAEGGDYDGSLYSYGGQAYLSGNYGGNSGQAGGDGGWGGGGEGGFSFDASPVVCGGGIATQGTPGGGGGGWNGGAGGGTLAGYVQPGGGGGSYTAPEVITTGCLAISGARSGHGIVSITHLQFNNIAPIDTTFAFAGNVFQTFTAPATGYYRITAKGGQGGAVASAEGGKGALLSGYFLLREGETLQIAAGGAGQNGIQTDNTWWSGGGGGGASSVVGLYGQDHRLLLMASGGGGAYFGNYGGPGLATPIQQSPRAGYPGYGGSHAEQFVWSGGGAGYDFDGRTPNPITAYGGQAYWSGNYGGNAGQAGGDGGWGGGGEGGLPNDDSFNFEFPITFHGSGGGGGGYWGGNVHAYDIENNENTIWHVAGFSSYSYSIANCSLSQLSGTNEGNGSVRIIGPHVAIDTVNTPGPNYTWAANGVTYQHSGTYSYADIDNCIIRVLDLSIGGLGGCLNYTTIDTTITSCGSFTNPLNGRTYTENTTDSIRVGCVKYLVKLIVAPPAELLGNMITGGSSQSGMVACNDSEHTYTISPVPYATSYEWTLPTGATGTSSTNSITVQFGNDFNGGSICVTPMNDCGSGENICKMIYPAIPFPSGDIIQISAPQAPYITGNYAATEIFGATTYTWSVSNNEAVIVSGQGTPNIQLEAAPGITGLTTLSVVAENCLGSETSASIILVDAVSVEEEEMVVVDGITLYPNPSKGQFTLSTPSLKEDAVLEIYSMEGRLVYQTNIPANTNQTFIDLQQPSAGLYAVRLLAGNKLSSMKIIVN